MIKESQRVHVTYSNLLAETKNHTNYLNTPRISFIRTTHFLCTLILYFMRSESPNDIVVLVSDTHIIFAYCHGGGEASCA